MNIANYLKQKQALIDMALNDALPSTGTRPTLLHEAMRYCVLNGGKRIRPILCLAAAEAHRKGRFFGSIPVPLPAGLIQADNKISLTFPDDGGRVSTVVVEVHSRN